MENNNLLNGGLFSSKKEKVIETNELQVRGHLLRWKDVVIQISSISQIAIGNYPKPPFPLWSVAAILIGMFFLSINIFIGLIGVLLGCVVIAVWYDSWWSKKDYKFLHLFLNSGTSFSILFDEEPFLRKVLDVFANIFEDVEKNVNNNLTIDIKNCTVKDNGTFIGTLNDSK